MVLLLPARTCVGRHNIGPVLCGGEGGVQEGKGVSKQSNETIVAEWLRESKNKDDPHAFGFCPIGVCVWIA